MGNRQKGGPGLRLSSRARVLIFLGIVFPLTWLIDLANWRLGGATNQLTFPLLMVVAMFVPALAAAIMLDLVTKEGLRFAGLRLGNKRYIIIAYLIMLAIAVITYALTIAVGWGRIDSGAVTFSSFFTSLGLSINMPPLIILGSVVFVALTLGIAFNSVYAFGEELGWRGYLLPNLLQFGKLKACLISGAIWGVWHAPVIMMGDLYPGYHYIGILMITIMCILLGIIFGYLRLSSGSLIAPIVAHAALNAQILAYLPSFLVTDVNPVLGGGSGIIGLGVMGIFALALWLTGKLK